MHCPYCQEQKAALTVLDGRPLCWACFQTLMNAVKHHDLVGLFVRYSEIGSLTRAARETDISPITATGHLDRLEGMFGPLTWRTATGRRSNKFRPTEVAERLLEIWAELIYDQDQRRLHVPWLNMLDQRNLGRFNYHGHAANVLRDG